jgi:outer membrane protein assembly factor BamD
MWLVNGVFSATQALVALEHDPDPKDRVSAKCRRFSEQIMLNNNLKREWLFDLAIALQLAKGRAISATMASPVMGRAAGDGFERLMSIQNLTCRLRGLLASTRRLQLAASLVVLAIPLSGCGTGALWDKFMAKDDTFNEEPADKLYNEGLYLMNEKNDNKAASKKFEEVDRQHPYSDWARKSLLMSAYAYYNVGDYDSCIGAASRYVTLHPGSPDAAYAQYLIAASHYDQIPDISRDQGRTEKAIAALEEVVRKYPNSEYAVSAKAKMEGARDQLAGKEMDIGRYYLEKRDYIAAINRFKAVVTQYQTTRHVEEALARLTEAYMSIGQVGEAQTAAAVLGHNFPDSKWYQDAYNLVKSGGYEPQENKGSYISRAFKKLGLG